MAAVPAAATAQRIDTIAVAPRQQPEPDLATEPPLSRGKAFLYSFLLPGYSQAVMGRSTATVIFSGIEIVGWTMLHRSLQDLSTAKQFRRDSVVATYRIDPATGMVERDPDTGEPVVATLADEKYKALVAARRLHVEDWAAILVFNHLISGADALVSAILWDVPGEVRIRSTPRGPVLMGTIRW